MVCPHPPTLGLLFRVVLFAPAALGITWTGRFLGKTINNAGLVKRTVQIEDHFRVLPLGFRDHAARMRSTGIAIQGEVQLLVDRQEERFVPKDLDDLAIDIDVFTPFLEARLVHSYDKVRFLGPWLERGLLDRIRAQRIVLCRDSRMMGVGA